MKRLNPDGTNMFADNGFFGAEDPEPLMFVITAVEVNKLRLAIESIASALEAWIDRMRTIKSRRT